MPTLALDGLYCVSLQASAPAEAAGHFHALGRCRAVTFYRPALDGVEEAPVRIAE